MLRRDIVAGRLPPATRLTEQSLARRHGVSRVPVREALRALAAEGFVESRPHAGSRVASIPFDEADDLFAVREALEISTARRAAQRARALIGRPAPADWLALRRELEDLVDAGDAAVAEDELERLVPINDRFHLAVAELSGSHTLANLLRQLSAKIEWLYALDTFSRGKRLWPDHRRILAAIDSADEALAAEVMGWHVRGSRVGYLSRTEPAERVARLAGSPPTLSPLLDRHRPRRRTHDEFRGRAGSEQGEPDPRRSRARPDRPGPRAEPPGERGA